jgi:hypothetical protein
MSKVKAVVIEHSIEYGDDGKVTNPEVLWSLQVKDLKLLAKGFEGYSKMKKQELINALAGREVLKPDLKTKKSVPKKSVPKKKAEKKEPKKSKSPEKSVSVEITEAGLRKMKVAQIRALLALRGLESKGTKNQLMELLLGKLSQKPKKTSPKKTTLEKPKKASPKKTSPQKPKKSTLEKPKKASPKKTSPQKPKKTTLEKPKKASPKKSAPKKPDAPLKKVATKKKSSPVKSLSVPVSKERLNAMTVVELKKLAKTKGIEVKGTKQKIIETLEKFSGSKQKDEGFKFNSKVWESCDDDQYFSQEDEVCKDGEPKYPYLEMPGKAKIVASIETLKKIQKALEESGKPKGKIITKATKKVEITGADIFGGGETSPKKKGSTPKKETPKKEAFPEESSSKGKKISTQEKSRQELLKAFAECLENYQKK